MMHNNVYNIYIYIIWLVLLVTIDDAFDPQVAKKMQ